MPTTRLSTKGQLILPKEIRDRYGWAAGIELAIEERGDALLIRPVENLRTTTIADIVGSTGYEGPRRTLEEMEDAIDREARKKR